MKHAAVAIALSMLLAACASTSDLRTAYAPLRVASGVPFDAAWKNATRYARNCYIAASVNTDRHGDSGEIDARIIDVVSMRLFAMDLRATREGTEVLIYGPSAYAEQVRERLPDWLSRGDGAGC